MIKKTRTCVKLVYVYLSQGDNIPQGETEFTSEKCPGRQNSLVKTVRGDKIP